VLISFFLLNRWRSSGDTNERRGRVREGCGGDGTMKLDTYAEKAKSLGVSKAEIIDAKNVVVEN
jgi:hypothetical protein